MRGLALLFMNNWATFQCFMSATLCHPYSQHLKKLYIPMESHIFPSLTAKQSCLLHHKPSKHQVCCSEIDSIVDLSFFFTVQLELLMPVSTMSELIQTLNTAWPWRGLSMLQLQLLRLRPSRPVTQLHLLRVNKAFHTFWHLPVKLNLENQQNTCISQTGSRTTGFMAV